MSARNISAPAATAAAVSAAKTSVVCTLGPATSTAAHIKQLLQAGMTVARFNLMHGTRASHTAAFRTLHQVLASSRRLCATVVSLQGINIRTGLSESAVTIEQGQLFTWHCDASVPLSSRGGHIACPLLPQFVRCGQTISINDGHLEFSVYEVTPTKLICQAVTSGSLGSYMRVHVPDAVYPQALLDATVKRDLDDAKHFAALGADFVSCGSLYSHFVDFFQTKNAPCVLLQVEDKQTVELSMKDEIPSIVQGFLLLRGRLGACVPASSIPGIQRKLAEKCNQRCLPMIVGNQTLMSMVSCPRPNRAEAADVAGAVREGVHAILLTGETAIGAYAVEAVLKIMQIIVATEKVIDYRAEYIAIRKSIVPPIPLQVSIASGASRLGYDVQANVLLLLSKSKILSDSVSKFRSSQIVQVTDDEKLATTILLNRGRTVYLVKDLSKTNAEDILKQLHEENVVHKGEPVVVVEEESVRVVACQ